MFALELLWHNDERRTAKRYDDNATLLGEQVAEEMYYVRGR